MNPLDFEELVALDAVGALTGEDRRRLDAGLQGASDDTRLAAAALYSAAEALAAAVPSVAPPPRVREQLLAKLAPAPFTFLMSDEGLEPHPLPGAQVKVLSHDRDRGIVTLLLRAPGGTVHPGHHHSGAEECYVIAGDVTVAGRRLGPGDFHHADAHTDHGPLTTDHGATVLLIVAAEDYLQDQ